MIFEVSSTVGLGANSQSSLGTPSSGKTESQRIVSDSGYLTPLHQAPGNSVQGQDSIGPHVSCLLCSGFPLAVLFAVVSIVVNSSDGVGQSWSWRHVRDEVGHIMPSFVNPDSAPPISLPSGTGWVVASLHDARPNTEQRMLRQPVCYFTGRYGRNSIASATSSASFLEAAPTHFSRFPAITQASPLDFPSFGSTGIINHKKMAESFPSQVFDCVMQRVCGNILVGHDVSPESVVFKTTAALQRLGGRSIIPGGNP